MPRLATYMSLVSTHAPAKGATTNAEIGYIHEFGFNPRAREGRDFTDGRHLLGSGVSTHAPAKGAT